MTNEAIEAAARAISLAWMKDERWVIRHATAPIAYFWAELAAKAALASVTVTEGSKKILDPVTANAPQNSSALNQTTGWQWAPVEPTKEMLTAAKCAIKRYIDGLPNDIRARAAQIARHGIKVGDEVKHRLRYQAMLAAALPSTPSATDDSAATRSPSQDASTTRLQEDEKQETYCTPDGLDFCKAQIFNNRCIECPENKPGAADLLAGPRRKLWIDEHPTHAIAHKIVLRYLERMRAWPGFPERKCPPEYYADDLVEDIASQLKVSAPTPPLSDHAQGGIDTAGLTEDQIDDIRSHILGTVVEKDTYHAPEHGWTCFHCGENFKTAWGARLHFGDGPANAPACRAIIKLKSERDVLTNSLADMARRVERYREALKPFAGGVFNDNGDMTITPVSDRDSYTKAYFVYSDNGEAT